MLFFLPNSTQILSCDVFIRIYVFSFHLTIFLRKLFNLERKGNFNAIVLNRFLLNTTNQFKFHSTNKMTIRNQRAKLEHA